jgi:mono/diheme cytochrome c family protein
MKYLFMALLALSACQEDKPAPVKPPEVVVVTPVEPPKPEEPKVLTQSEKVALGEKRYKATCMACHGNAKIGASGPANALSSKELLQLKVLEGKYPVGYKPKRATKAMPRFPQLKNDIDNLYEYLNQPSMK